jgi:glutamate/tyrosine decarboxylase-like PLP-dependent enzyme
MYANGKNIDTKAAFLGPQAENKEILEELIFDALRDYIYWRRNIHPEDSPSIKENDKLQSSFIETRSAFKQELFNILSELKKGAPVFSKRYFGHILGDLFIPSIAGYFAAMLYNQNNVVAEVSPVTIEKELDYLKEVSKMLSYPELDVNKLSKLPKKTSWGHLSAGGTTANLEAMWVARNIKFYPLAVALMAKINAKFRKLKDLEIILPDFKKARISDLTAFHALSLTTEEILNMNYNIFRLLDYDKVLIKEFEIEVPTIQKIGLVNFYKECEKSDLKFNLPKIIIPQTAHYCWFKLMDILGLGKENLIELEVNLDFMMDILELDSKLEETLLTPKVNDLRTPILAVVGICGTTEEGAIDPLIEINNFRKKYEQSGISFWLHSDAAIGGYFASMLKDKDFQNVENKELSDIKELKYYDSIVIDPHKLGYVPYPAGAVIYKDSRVREHITYDAPYLNESEDIRKTNLGKWTLEGSRPGASAISCYLAQHSFPLNSEGYGKILNECLNVRDRLIKAFENVNNNELLNRGFQIKLLYRPQLNIICYTVASEKFLKTPECLNKMNKRLYEKLSVSGDSHAGSYQYLVSKTEYPVKKYDKVLHHLRYCQVRPFNPNDDDYKLVTLRTVLMNPLLDDDKILNGFAQHMCELAEELLPEIQIDKILRLNNSMRMRIAIAEDENEHRKSLRYHLEFDQTLSKGLEVRSADKVKDFLSQIENYEPNVVITDINFQNNILAGIELIRTLKGTNYKFLDGKSFKNIIVYSAFLGDRNITRELNELNIPEQHRIAKSPNKDFNKDCAKILNVIMESFI